MKEIKLDRRRKYYLILDCETATLPFVEGYSDNQRRKISIAKPLIYDLGWTIVDRCGNIYVKRNFLVSEIFSVPSIFNTAYYREKRPLYIEKIAKNLIEVVNWKTASETLEYDLAQIDCVGAYNSMFDFKKAIPFTDLYINMLYSSEFHQWMNYQKDLCVWIANNGSYTKSEDSPAFEPDVFRYHGKTYSLFDIWGLACNHILNCPEYKEMCLAHNWITASGKYFSTTAENAFRFLNQQYDFTEQHTALDDCLLESAIFAEVVKRVKNKWERGIIYFPFKKLGEVQTSPQEG